MLGSDLQLGFSNGKFFFVRGSGSLPLLKKPLLDPTILDNFCPVSHLPFLKKVVGKMIVHKLQRTLDEVDYLV